MSAAQTTSIQYTHADTRTLVHGSAAALNGRAVLFVGPSGSGKSAHVLELMAAGAKLISDDRVTVETKGNSVLLSAPEEIAGKIEARGMGVLSADFAQPTKLALVVDLGTVESDRLPPSRDIELLGVRHPIFHKVESHHFVPAILQYLKSGTAS